MITLQIEEYKNGFSVVMFDPKQGKIIDEIQEERMDVLKTILTWVTNEIDIEIESRR